MKLKIYNIICDMLDKNTHLDLVSFVKHPAIQTNFLIFNEDKKLKSLHLSDYDKHIVTGAALIPDQLIYRHNRETGEEYYIRFSKETIELLVEQYNEMLATNNMNVEHNDNMTLNTNDVVMLESYFINKERGINPVEFSDLPDGTWIVSYKVRNEKLWQEIKEGKYKGFSIEGLLKYSDSEETYDEDDVESLLDELFGLK